MPYFVVRALLCFTVYRCSLVALRCCNASLSYYALGARCEGGAEIYLPRRGREGCICSGEISERKASNSNN